MKTLIRSICLLGAFLIVSCSTTLSQPQENTITGAFKQEVRLPSDFDEAAGVLRSNGFTITKKNNLQLIAVKHYTPAVRMWPKGSSGMISMENGILVHKQTVTLTKTSSTYMSQYSAVESLNN